MNDAVNFRVRSKNLIQLSFVGNVSLVEDRSLAAEKLNAVYSDLGRVVETVDDDNIVAVLQKSKRRERANVAGATTSHTVVSRVPFSPSGQRAMRRALFRAMAGRQLEFPVLCENYHAETTEGCGVLASCRLKACALNGRRLQLTR